jgi:predicted MFS family arabinose efflux permease
VSGRDRTVFYVVVIIAGIGLGMTYPLMSLLATAWGASAGVAGWLVAAIVPGMLLVDGLGTRFVPRMDGRTALSLSLLVYGSGCLVVAAANGLGVIFAGRLLEGAGCAMFMTGGLHLVVRLAPAGGNGRAIGLFNVFWFVGLAAGPLLGGAIADLQPGQTGLRVAFLVCGLTNVVGALLARLALPSYPSGRRPELGLPRLVGLRRGRTPLALLLGGYGEAIRDAVQMMVLPLVGVAVLGLSDTQVGIVLAVMAVTDIVGMGLSGVVTDRWGRCRPLVGLLLAGAVVAVFGVGIDGMLGMVVIMTALGIPFGAIWVVPQACVVDLAVDRESSLAAYRITADLGMLVGVTGAGAVVGLADGTSVFLWIAGALVAGALLTRAVGETHRRVPSPVPPIVEVTA